MIHWENHCGDDEFETPETAARASWYGVSGIPHVRIDGSRNVIGASSCSGAAAQYRSNINTRLNEVGNNSPVEITGAYFGSETSYFISATFRLIDPVALTNLRATLLIYEDNVGSWQHVTRDLYDQNVTLANPGDEVSVATTMPIDPSWDIEDIHVVAYLQQTSGNKQMIQGARLGAGYFTVDFVYDVRSVPNGSGTATYEGTISNIGSSPDTFTLSEGTPFGDWWVDVRMEGNPNWQTLPISVDVGSGEAIGFEYRVHTDGAVEIRNGAVSVASQAAQLELDFGLRLFNGSYSIYLIDDDNANTNEVPIDNALTNLGYLRDLWRVVEVGMSPTATDLSGYDIVLWTTGIVIQGQVLGTVDCGHLKTYVDAGGRLMLVSQHFLNNVTGIDPLFISDYLGVAGRTLDTAYTHMDGVPGDPIGADLNLELNVVPPTFNKGDHVVPSATASVFLTAPNSNNCALRTESGDMRVVFLPFALHAVVDEGAPNNVQGVVERSLDWLAPETVGVDDLTAGLLASRIQAVRPNPFNPQTEISFTVSQAAASAPVLLDVYDLSGRRIARLFHGMASPGPNAAVWTGLSDSGQRAENGVYFARLTTSEGRSSEKLILLR